MSSTPRIRLPASAAPGEVVELRTLIDHPMVTAVATPGPRDMPARFEVMMNGARVLSCEFDNGSAANPFFSFFVRIDETSDFVFVWTHEDGHAFTAEGRVEVS